MRVGHTIWLQVTDGTMTTGDEGDHSFPLLLQEELDTLAERLGVPKLSTFYDYSTLTQEFGDELGDLASASPAQVWFDSHAGHSVISAMLHELRERPEGLNFRSGKSRSHWPAALVGDLEHLKAGLDQAVAHGHKFRLLIVP